MNFQLPIANRSQQDSTNGKLTEITVQTQIDKNLSTKSFFVSLKPVFKNRNKYIMKTGLFQGWVTRPFFQTVVGPFWGRSSKTVQKRPSNSAFTVLIFQVFTKLKVTYLVSTEVQTMKVIRHISIVQ